MSIYEDFKENFLGIIESFSEEGGVILVSGPWGSGKTHFWQNFVRSYGKELSWSRYSYVSLFGVTSADEVRRRIVYSSESLKTGNSLFPSGLQKLIRNAAPGVIKGASKILTYGEALPVQQVTEYIDRRLFIQATINALVCLDDLERVTDSVDLRTIFGVVDELRRERDTIIVIICNTDQLSENNREIYKQYFEKTVDVFLRLPTDIDFMVKTAFSVFTNDGPPSDGSSMPDVSDIIASRCKVLDVHSFRFVFSVVRRFFYLKDILEQHFHEEIDQNRLGRVVLDIAWRLPLILAAHSMHGQHEHIPSLEMLEKENTFTLLFSSDRKSKLEENSPVLQQLELLERYGLLDIDILFRGIIEYIRHGYATKFLFDAFSEHCKNIEDVHEKSKIEAAITQYYHSSLVEDEDEHRRNVDALHEVFDRHIGVVSPYEIVFILRLLRETGRDDKANNLAEKWFSIFKKKHGRSPDLSYVNSEDMDEYLFSLVEDADKASSTPAVTQEDLEDAFDRLCNREKSFEELYYIYEHATQSQFESLFSRNRPDIMYGVSVFIRHYNNMLPSSSGLSNAINALKKIARDNHIARRKLVSLGLSLD